MRYWLRQIILLLLLLLHLHPSGAAGSSPAQEADSIRVLLDQSASLLDTRPQAAVGLLRQAMELALLQRDSTAIARCCMSLGQGVENLGTYDRALDYYLKALDIFQQQGDSTHTAYAYDSVGFIYWYLDNYEKAMAYYMQAFSLYQHLDDLPGQARLYNHQGLIYWRWGQFDQALKAYDQSLAIFRENGAESSIPAVYNNIGLVYQQMGQLQKALNNFTRALAVNDRLDKKWSLSENHNNIANVYISLKDFPRAFSHLNEARRLAVNLESKYLLCDNHHLYYTLYQQTGDFARALEHYHAYTALNTELTSNRVQGNIADLQIRYAIEKKEDEIRLLRAEQALNEEQIRSHRQWMRLWAVITAIILSASVVLFRQRRETERAYRDLVSKNLELVRSEKQISQYRSVQRTFRHQPADQEANHKYSGSALTEEQKQRIMDDLETLMETQKFYVNHDVTMNRVSEHLHISRTYLSQVINEKLGKSFISYINGLRIREARHLLSEDLNRLYTIESISTQVGFNSTNVFNKAFKKCTGVTPSFYIKSLQSQSRINC